MIRSIDLQVVKGERRRLCDLVGWLAAVGLKCAPWRLGPWRAHLVHQRDDRRGIRHAQRTVEEAARSAPSSVSHPKRERATAIIDGRPTAAHPWKQRQPRPAA